MRCCAVLCRALVADRQAHSLRARSGSYMSVARSPQSVKRYSSADASLMTTPRQDNRRVSLLAQSSAFRSPPSRSRGSGRIESVLFPSGSSQSSDGFEEASVGDLVEVPGGWHGNVMYVGPVNGRSGTFLGVDLIELDADKGRHNGTYNGVSYFLTKSSISGMFVPQGRCRIIDGKSRKLRAADHPRPSSRQLHIRPNSRMRSVSGRSSSMQSGVSSPPRSATYEYMEAENPAAVQQKLLNDNARLSKELEDTKYRLGELNRARAVQVQETEELMSTVAELEAMQNRESKQNVTLAELEEMRAYIDERERKIEQLRADAEVRRTEFRQVTEHQQVTIEELKALHKLQIAEIQEKNSDMEERLLNSSGEDGSLGQTPEQMEVLQGQLADLSEELDVLVSHQERARQDIDIANSRIADLEHENNRLLDELAEAHMALEHYKTKELKNPLREARRVSSLENLPAHHPQKKQAIEFLEIEVRRLKEENETLRGHEATQANPVIPQFILDELTGLQGVVDQLQADDTDRAANERELNVLRTNLERERTAHEALKAHYEQMEKTLEQTIMRMNIEDPQSPQTSPTRKDKTVEPLSPIVARRVSTESDLRSPRANRGIEQEVPSDGVLFCEYCEQHGHDIVSCKAVFGSAGPTPVKNISKSPNNDFDNLEQADDDDDDLMF